MVSVEDNFRDVTYDAKSVASQDHIQSEEEEVKTFCEDVTTENRKTISIDEHAIEEENKMSNEVNISTSEICKNMHENDILCDKLDVNKILSPGNEQDSGVFEDISNNKLVKVLEEDSTSDMEASITSSMNKDDTCTPVENELAFHKDIFEDEVSCNEALTNPEAVANSDLEDSLSQKDELDVELEAQESEYKCRSTSKDLTLPYFQLPKPDLDEFLIETEKNLQIDILPLENKMRKSASLSSEPKLRKNIIVPSVSPQEHPKRFFESKEAFITIDLSCDYSKLSSKNNSWKEVHISENIKEVSSCSVKNEYEKVISSINKDESDLPGIKRLALKEFLKKQIDQKRYEAFCHSKILNNEDEEMDEEAYIEGDEGRTKTDDEESTSDEEEEPTVTFENKTEELGDGSESEAESASANKPDDEFPSDGDKSDNESDDDFIGVKKTKKKILVLDEDSCDDEDFTKDKNSLEMESTSSLNLKMSEYVENEDDKNSKDESNMSDNESLNRDSKLCKNKERSFGEGVFQSHEKISALSQISSSMPSYQPGGGFNQEHTQEDSLESVVSSVPSQQSIPDNINEESQDSYMHYQSEENFLGSSRTPVLENDAVLEKSSFIIKNDSNAFNIKLDNLPVSQTENDSDIFSTKELADVCSGAFNESDVVPEKRLEDVLEFPSDEKVTDFFDDEAELSGEDDGVDEKDEDCEDDNLICPSDEEDLPEAEILREEIADLHMKRIMDDDAERIREIQEQFLDDGELNNDGTGRSRRFAWINNDADLALAPAGNNSDSDSDAEFPDDTLSSINQEKAKWRQENKEDDEEDLTEELNSSGYRRKSFLKVNIIGKPKFSQDEDKSKRLSGKRPRGSFLNLDDGSATQVLKKLKASEDNMGGSRTTKHFVFRNDLTDSGALSKGIPVKSVFTDSFEGNGSPKLSSIFNTI